MRRYKAEVPIEDAMVEFATGETLKVRRKTRLEDEVFLVVPRVEWPAD
jgi:hypothetical protein